DVDGQRARRGQRGGHDLARQRELPAVPIVQGQVAGHVHGPHGGGGGDGGGARAEETAGSGGGELRDIAQAEKVQEVVVAGDAKLPEALVRRVAQVRMLQQQAQPLLVLHGHGVV
ncbi:hypothetical protein EG861_14700, partial [Enterococcus faecalis]